MGKHIGENISKNLDSKYRHNLIVHAKQFAALIATKFATDAPKTTPKTRQFKKS